MGLSKRNVLNERNVLKAILAVDGPGSNIDADMVDGYHAEELLPEIDPVTGNWVIGGENIGVSAQGPAGEPGATPTIDPITKHWIINGVDTGVSAEGQPGESEVMPSIDPETKHWIINGVDTGISAEGQPGEPGATPVIDPETKHWLVNGIDTGVLAEGQGGSGIVVIPQGSDIPIAERTENTWYFKVTDTQSNITQTVRVAPNIGFSFE